MLFPYDALQGLKSKVITSKITIQQAKRSCKSTQSEISKCLLSLLIAGEQVGYQRRAPARAAQRVSNSLDWRWAGDSTSSARAGPFSLTLSRKTLRSAHSGNLVAQSIGRDWPGTGSEPSRGRAELGTNRRHVARRVWIAAIATFPTRRICARRPFLVHVVVDAVPPAYSCACSRRHRVRRVGPVPGTQAAGRR